MLKLSAKGRYGTRVMVDLARNYGQGYIFLSDIAKRQSISRKYLEQICISLKTAGLISSARGVSGGYALAEHPKDINLKDILETLEKDLSIAECLKTPYDCKRTDSCETREIWKLLRKNINSMLSSITLDDILKKKITSEVLTKQLTS